MKNRRPSTISTTSTYKVPAKDLRKGDNIWIGDRVYTVKTNEKNDFGQRAIHLTWGSRKKKDSATLVVRGRVTFNVKKVSYVRDARV